jgi:hypothetical protein
VAVAPGWWFDGEGGEGGWVAVSCGHWFIIFCKKNMTINYFFPLLWEFNGVTAYHFYVGISTCYYDFF